MDSFNIYNYYENARQEECGLGLSAGECRQYLLDLFVADIWEENSKGLACLDKTVKERFGFILSGNGNSIQENMRLVEDLLYEHMDDSDLLGVWWFNGGNVEVTVGD